MGKGRKKKNPDTRIKIFEKKLVNRLTDRMNSSDDEDRVYSKDKKERHNKGKSTPESRRRTQEVVCSLIGNNR